MYAWSIFVGSIFCRLICMTCDFHYIPSSEILEFPSVINFDIITCDDINFHLKSLPAVI